MNFFKLRFIQRQRPLIFISEIFPFPNQAPAQLCGKADGKARIRRALWLEALGTQLILLKIRVIGYVRLPLRESHDVELFNARLGGTVAKLWRLSSEGKSTSRSRDVKIGFRQEM